MVTAIESIATIGINSNGGIVGVGKPNGMLPINRISYLGPKSIAIEITLAPTTAISSAGNGNLQTLDNLGLAYSFMTIMKAITVTDMYTVTALNSPKRNEKTKKGFKEEGSGN